MNEQKEIVVKMGMEVNERTVIFVNGIVLKAKEFEIDNEQKLVLSADILKQIKMAEKDLERERKNRVAPLNNYVKDINSQYKPLTEPLVEAKGIITGKVITYHTQKEEEAAKEQARLRREETMRLKKLEEEKAALEVKGIKLQMPEVETEAPITVAPPEKKISGIYSTATIQERPEFRLVDIKKVPSKYLLFNQVEANKSAREGVRNIEGCEFYFKKIIVNR